MMVDVFRMIADPVKYKTINQYLEAAGCQNRTGIEEFFVLKFSELSINTVRQMEACQKDFYQINFITHAGDGIYWFNTREKNQTANTIYFISPEHVYSWIRDEKLRGYLLYFKKSFLNFYKGDIDVDLMDFFDVCRENSLSLQDQGFSNVLTLVDILHSSYHNPGPFRLQVLRATLLNLLFYLKSVDVDSHEKRSLNDMGARQFTAYKNLVNNLFLKVRTVNKYASLLNISPNHLNAICKSKSGKTAKEIITERVLEEAKFLVAFTGKDFAEIAFYLGFTEPTHFSRFFKRKTGTSPIEYRKTNS